MKTEIKTYKSGRQNIEGDPERIYIGIYYFTSQMLRYLFAKGIAPFGNDTVRRSQARGPNDTQLEWLYTFLGTTELTQSQFRHFISQFQNEYRNNLETLFQRSRSDRYGPVMISQQCFQIFEGQ